MRLRQLTTFNSKQPRALAATLFVTVLSLVGNGKEILQLPPKKGLR